MLRSLFATTVAPLTGLGLLCATGTTAFAAETGQGYTPSATVSVTPAYAPPPTYAPPPPPPTAATSGLAFVLFTQEISTPVFSAASPSAGYIHCRAWDWYGLGWGA